MNPFTSLVGELSKRQEFRILFLSTPNFKDQIEKSGGEYIEYACSDLSQVLASIQNTLLLIKTLINATFKILPQVIEICEEYHT